MNFKLNNYILKYYSELRKNNQRNIDLLAYLGNAYDSYKINNIHHPHIKRTETLLFLQNLHNDKIKILYTPPQQKEFIEAIPPEYTSLPKPFNISDDVYRFMCSISKATLNIAGLRGSIPFRFIDAFLSGMLIFTDTPLVKWYAPLRDGQEIFDLGPMAYEILTDKEKLECMNKLIYFIENVDKLRKEVIAYQNEFFENYLTPEKMCEYILNECEKIL